MAAAMLPAVALVWVLTATIATVSANFTCASPATCQALVGYVSVNFSTFSEIETLFGVGSLRSLLAANNQPPGTPGTTMIPAGTAIRVPIPCNCTGGGGVSNNRPIYTVQRGDGLDAIARNRFSGLLRYQDIVKVNNIPDPNLIQPGQVLWIPLPCSCDEVDGFPTVHYAHKVAPESTLELIAAEFGTTEATLMKLNGITDPKSIRAEAVLDVPLRACNSSIGKTASDGSLRVPNGSYALTAKDCVRCSCSAATWELQCDPAQGLAESAQCPPIRCGGAGNLFLGNTSSAGCGSSTCSYAGYVRNGTILTTLITQSTCSGSGGSPPSPSGNSAPAAFRGMRWGAASLGLLSSSVLLF